MRNLEDTSTFAVFPFLKTTHPVTIGPHTFQSTNDLTGLSASDAERLSEIADMLFLKDDFRIRSASFTAMRHIKIDRGSAELDVLQNVQAIVAYAYASPHAIFGDPFLPYENASMVVFSPQAVSIHLLQPDYNVVPLSPRTLIPDERGEVDGYAGLYNFRHYFWIAKGSRLYGPSPDPGLNISQDLSTDLGTRGRSDAPYQRLGGLLLRPLKPNATRLFTALRWYNAANEDNLNDDSALVNLAIAFEAVLGLPASEKSDRFVDAISLILGRTPRLDRWAQQFYAARSQIAHEGGTTLRRFSVATSKPDEAHLYQSLSSYGRQVFRLCLSTLLLGMELAEEIGLEAKLVTNQERFEHVCEVLGDESIDPRVRLSSALPLIVEIEKYQFLAESGLRLATILGAVKALSRTRLAWEDVPDERYRGRLEAAAAAIRSSDHFQELEALRDLEDALPTTPPPDSDEDRALHLLVTTAWRYLYRHYFWLKQSHEEQGDAGSPGA
jgi:hypothetical protein